MKQKENKTGHLKFLEPVISIVFWGLLFISPLVFSNFENGIIWKQIFNVWRSFIPYLSLFLLNRFVLLPFFFFRRRRWVYFISNILLILVMAFGVHFYRTRVIQPQRKAPPREAHPRPGIRPPGAGERLPAQGERLPGLRERPLPGQNDGRPPLQLPPFLSFMVVSVLIIGFDTGLMISVKWAQSEQLRIQAEKENMVSQLAFLQNQVSPHFFMNTLNNIHSLIDIDSGEAKDAIIKLSKLMRHMLYESRVETIPLKKEIDFIRNYVALMKLRFSDKVKVSLKVPDQIPEKNIPPLLFTSFVENAFKHGISYQESSFIDISFSYDSGLLSFVTRNSNPKNKKDEGHSGIGIENSRKRLDLIYGNACTLEINDSPEEFTVNLEVPL